MDETVSVMFMFVPLRLMVHSKLFHQAALVFWWPVAISTGGFALPVGFSGSGPKFEFGLAAGFEPRIHAARRKARSPWAGGFWPETVAPVLRPKRRIWLGET